LVLACDGARQPVSSPKCALTLSLGIWDCLTSQQVVDFVRLQVSEGKQLSEIGEMMCEHCLAPDTSSGAGIGCDNMTVLIIALLHGRTKEEWYTWITDRVKNQYGYPTPSTIPQLYAYSRLMSFKARREASESRERLRADLEESPSYFGTGLGGFARVLGSNGGISFHPGSGILSDSGSLMFAGDDSDEDDESGDEVASGSFFTETLGLGASRDDSPDPTQHLKAKLDEFEKDEDMSDEDMPADHSDSKGSDIPDEKEIGKRVDQKVCHFSNTFFFFVDFDLD